MIIQDNSRKDIHMCFSRVKNSHYSQSQEKDFKEIKITSGNGTVNLDSIIQEEKTCHDILLLYELG